MSEGSIRSDMAQHGPTPYSERERDNLLMTSSSSCNGCDCEMMPITGGALVDTPLNCRVTGDAAWEHTKMPYACLPHWYCLCADHQMQCARLYAASFAKQYSTPSSADCGGKPTSWRSREHSKNEGNVMLPSYGFAKMANGTGTTTIAEETEIVNNKQGRILEILCEM